MFEFCAAFGAGQIAQASAVARKTVSQHETCRRGNFGNRACHSRCGRGVTKTLGVFYHRDLFLNYWRCFFLFFFGGFPSSKGLARFGLMKVQGLLFRCILPAFCLGLPLRGLRFVGPLALRSPLTKGISTLVQWRHQLQPYRMTLRQAGNLKGSGGRTMVVQQMGAMDFVQPKPSPKCRYRRTFLKRKHTHRLARRPPQAWVTHMLYVLDMSMCKIHCFVDGSFMVLFSGYPQVALRKAEGQCIGVQIQESPSWRSFGAEHCNQNGHGHNAGAMTVRARGVPKQLAFPKPPPPPCPWAKNPVSGGAHWSRGKPCHIPKGAEKVGPDLRPHWTKLQEPVGWSDQALGMSVVFVLGVRGQL